MAGALDGYGRDVVVAARATDGRDFVKGIAGGWSTRRTLRRARERGIDWGHVVEESDSFTGAGPTWDNSLTGGRTGWNLVTSTSSSWANGDLGAQYHVDWFLATLHPLDLLVNEAAILGRAAELIPPTCGEMRTLSEREEGWPSGRGSGSVTSRARRSRPL